MGTAGLGAISALHAVWALGSSWPAKSPEELAEATVGQVVDVPAAGPTAVIAVGAAGAGILASGALGEGRPQRIGLRLLGSAMLARAAFGGDAALVVLGLPPAGERFRRLDRRFYRPLTAVLGIALWLASTKRATAVGTGPGPAPA